jgi:2-polyprenyl-3-methyl-5-hydroxy-6-metoxy-1,4-benzoquinol methylase/Tfp pilus assembly protein PilF
MATPRILTFNFHEPYLCLMAKTGLPLTVGTFEKGQFRRPWQSQFRPAPKNLTFVEESAWRSDLAAGRFDVVIAQNENNAADLFQYDAPALLICHNRRTFLKSTIPGGPEEGQVYDAMLERLFERFRFVFISESKRDDYGITGMVIRPGIDVEEYGGYTGEKAEVLRVGNMMRARNLMFDVDLQEAACAGLPNRVLGLDPSIPGARPSESFEDLLAQLRGHRCLLHVAREAYEDGYNLSSLEAMACGTPVVTLANRTSPITGGVDGLVGTDAASLNAQLRVLLDDPERARELGARGRETVAREFPIAAFVEKWKEAIEWAAESGRYRKKLSVRGAKAVRSDMLMEYIASPATTGRYMERALRKTQNLVTAGLRMPESILRGWGYDDPLPAYAPHKIDTPLNVSYAEILGAMEPGFEPQLFLWVDSGKKVLAEDVDLLTMPRICYLIDTHIDLQTRINVARQFDFVFMAQKAQVPDFVEAGMKRVHWLPLACSPELHDLPPQERIYDIAYVGSLTDSNDRRLKLFQRVRERFPNCKIGRFWPHQMADIYSRSKIVLNACVNRDVNMRVFEGLASGAMLITDEADGLEDLFEDGKHLAIYRRDEDLFELVERYLADTEARERIAAAGRAEVLENHTYDCRMTQMMDIVVEAMRSEGLRSHSEAYYGSARPELQCHVPQRAKRILDVGCGEGAFGHSLKARGAKEVVGIETVEAAWKRAKNVLDNALLGDIEKIELPYEDGYFDCITCCDVLEHLVDPAAALRKLSRVLAPDGQFVISIPNVRFFQVVEALAHGRWPYGDSGILDRTHLRFFTKVELPALIDDAGLDLRSLQPLTVVPPDMLPRAEDGSIRLGRMLMQDVGDDEYEDFRTFQYVMSVGKPADASLEDARHALAAGENERAYTLASRAAESGTERRRILAKALGRLGRLDAAASLYREALAEEPRADAAAELGLVLVAMGQLGEAKAFLERAIAADPEDDRAYSGLALVDLSEERPADALERFKTALDRNFDNEVVVGHLLETAERLDRLEEAEPYLRRFVDFYPGNADMACRHVEVLQGLGQHAEVAERLELLLLLFPEHAGVRALWEASQGDQ